MGGGIFKLNRTVIILARYALSIRHYSLARGDCDSESYYHRLLAQFCVIFGPKLVANEV